jgi:hypothetical protein
MKILAQLESVPSDTLKWIVIVLLVLLGAAASITMIWKATQKNALAIDPQPVEVSKSPKRFNFERTEARFVEHDRRLDEHGGEIQKLWTTMRDEDSRIREENREQFLAISRSLGRIEGRLNVNNAPES